MFNVIMKITAALNMIRFINGVLWALLNESNLSPQNREYIEGKMFDCVSMLESIIKDLEEELKKMTELEIFAKDIIESGGEFWTLETSTKGKLAKTVTHYTVKGHVYNEVRFQVFNKEGKRIFVNTSLTTARAVYDSMIEGRL